MTNCAKCGAELIGNKKFCAACGAPVSDPRNVGSAPGGAPGAPASAYGGAPPASQVNPFAATAFPGGKKEERPSLYGPPPELKNPLPAAGAPPAAPVPAESSQISQMTGPSSQVSPLAVSNALSQRPAEVQSAMSAAQSMRQPPSAVAQPPRPPGTAQMPSVPKQAAAQPASPAAPAVSQGKKGGTQMMSPVSYAQAHAQQPATSGRSPSAPAPPAPSSSGGAPAQPAAAPVIASPVPFPAPQVQQQYASSSPYASPMPGQAPVTPQNPWSTPGWNAAPQQQPYGYGASASGYGFAPGTHVMVTWSNGQRYPGTIHQTQGTRCLVVFPDGQQHWVEMQYIAPV